MRRFGKGHKAKARTRRLPGQMNGLERRYADHLNLRLAAGELSLDPQSRAGVTVEMKTSFLQPGGTPGTRIVASGHAFHRSTTMCFCEAELHEGHRLLAKAMGTFKYLKRLDVADKLTPEVMGRIEAITAPLAQ